MRGMMFGGFGPIIAGIVFLSLGFSLPDFSLTGWEAFLAILSTYLLSFLQAGASVFNQIEDWSVAKGTFFHLLTIYAAYVGCYLLNAWIPRSLLAVAIFTAGFLLTYLIIWLTVYLSVRTVSRRMNERLKE